MFLLCQINTVKLRMHLILCSSWNQYHTFRFCTVEVIFFVMSLETSVSNYAHACTLLTPCGTILSTYVNILSPNVVLCIKLCNGLHEFSSRGMKYVCRTQHNIIKHWNYKFYELTVRMMSIKTRTWKLFGILNPYKWIGDFTTGWRKFIVSDIIIYTL